METYRKDDVVQKQHLVKSSAILVQFKQILQRLIAQIGQVRDASQLLFISLRLYPAVALVITRHFILVRNMRNLQAPRDVSARELPVQIIQHLLCVVPAAALEDADKDVFRPKVLCQLNDGLVPVLLEYVAVVKVHARNVDALASPASLSGYGLDPLAREIVVDSEDVKDVEEEKRKDEDP